MTDAERKLYEACQIPLAIYTYEAGAVIPLLVSDGFCQLKGLTRQHLTRMLGSSI